MRFPTVLGIVIIFITWFAYQRRKSKILLEQDNEQFWNRESESNSVRKKSLDDLDYIYLRSEEFPMVADDDTIVGQCHEEFNKLINKKFVNLTGITNTDLKIMYGSANLPALSEYDDNFTDLVRLLNKWGKRLYELGFEDQAVFILEFAVNTKSDISETYKLLFKIYNHLNTPEKIELLIKTAESLNSINKKVILKYLNSAK